MKTLSAVQAQTSGSAATHFASSRALAMSLAESDNGLIEPELIAWADRSSATTSPVLEGCAGPEGWHDYGVSHGGRLEVRIDQDTRFIFAESSQFDSYAHFGPGPYRNVRDAQGNEFLCRAGGTACVALDDWTSKLT